MRIGVLLATALTLLLGDLAEAAPTGAGQPDRSRAGLAPATRALGQAGDEVLVARRRKKKRRKKRRPAPPPESAPAPAPAPEPDPMMESSAPAPTGGGSSLSRTTRIDFDAQLIKGQTTKAGEVQILERKDTELKSMVKRRTSFRDEIIHTVFPEK